MALARSTTCKTRDMLASDVTIRCFLNAKQSQSVPCERPGEWYCQAGRAVLGRCRICGRVYIAYRRCLIRERPKSPEPWVWTQRLGFSVHKTLVEWDLWRNARLDVRWREAERI